MQASSAKICCLSIYSLSADVLIVFPFDIQGYRTSVYNSVSHNNDEQVYRR